MENSTSEYQSLAAYRRCVERLGAQWPSFLLKRADRLRHGGESEKVAEAILEDLFTVVLDWSEGDLAYQVGYADIVLSHNLAKYMVIEVKRPGTLFPGRRAFDLALDQACRYAAEQRVPLVGASDGCYLYAAEVAQGGLNDRVLLDLSSLVAPPALWWLSVHGIYRPCIEAVAWPAASDSPSAGTDEDSVPSLLHPKYRLPARCFAYVGDPNAPNTWKLPYLQADGRADEKRLPKAIQSLLSNYRGTKVGGIPERDLPEVLQRLARAAELAGRMPPQASNAAPTYRQLAVVLEQIRSAQT